MKGQRFNKPDFKMYILPTWIHVRITKYEKKCK